MSSQVPDLRVPAPVDSPSSFLSADAGIVHIGTTDADVAPLLARAFVATGRVSHLVQVTPLD